jgi:hypothetical protein
MNDLSGKLIAYPTPGRAGFWAYRQLRSGHLLEVELTTEEWGQLRERTSLARTKEIHRLNQHPLNQAALRRLNKEGRGWLPDLMHLLALVWQGLPEDLEGDSPEGLTIAAWSRTARHQGAAIVELEGSLDPEDVEQLPLAAIAELVVETLTGASGN